MPMDCLIKNRAFLYVIPAIIKKGRRRQVEEIIAADLVLGLQRGQVLLEASMCVGVVVPTGEVGIALGEFLPK